MLRARFMIALTLFWGTLMTFAPAALARDDGGQGWWGESSDADITSVMFITIVFFPLLIVVLTIIQWRLEKRREAKFEATKRRAANADWRGGW
jgi:hypothetical protein